MAERRHAGASSPPRAPDALTHLVNLAVVARQFYVQGRNKSAIASDLGVSRFKVARLLKEASERGLVRVEVSLPPSVLDLELSAACVERYGLRRAYVLQDRGLPPESAREQLGVLTASVLAETIHEGAILGIAWGRTLDRMVDALPTIPSCTVVQIVGGMPLAGISLNSLDLARRIASRANGPVYSVHAPMIAPDATTARRLRADPQVAQTIAMFSRLTCAVVAVGSWDPPSSLMQEILDEGDRQRLRAAGVVADVGASLIRADGSTAVTYLDDRRIAISEQELRAVPEVIAVGGGATKAEAIRAVLKGRWATTLVTDFVAATILMQA
jgi:DNA-binding transcriptional regulator LsrR (DeoR family)